MKEVLARAAPAFRITAVLILAAALTLALFMLLACSGPVELSTTAGDPTPRAALSATPLQPTATSARDPQAVRPQPSTEPLMPGERYTFTLTVINRGPSAATGVRVTESLPPGVRLISMGPEEQGFCRATDQEDGATSIYSPTTVLCGLDFLAAGTTHTFALIVSPLTTTGVLTSSAFVAAREQDPNPADNRFDRRTLIRAIADLSLEVQASHPSTGANPFGEPNLAIFTLTVTNHGPALAAGVVLTGIVPAGATLAWSRPAAPACQRDGKSAGCQLGTLVAGRAATVTLDVSPGISENLSAGAEMAGLALELSGSACTPVGDTLICHLADLDVGQRAQIRLGVQGGAALSGTRASTATVAAALPDPSAANNTASAAVTFTSQPLARADVPAVTDLQLTVDAPAYALAGAPMSYAIHILNAGTGPAEGVTFSATLASGMVVESVQPPPPDCEPGPGRITCRLAQEDEEGPAIVTLLITSSVVLPTRVDLNAVAPGWPMCTVVKEATLSRAIRCTLGPLPGGATTQVSFLATASGMLSRVLTQTLQVGADSVDVNPGNNRTQITTTLDVAADVLVRPTVTEPAAPGETFNVTWTITNAGPSDANRVVFTGALPSGVTALSAAGGPEDACQIATGWVLCKMSRLNQGQTEQVALTLRLDEPFEPPLQHIAAVTAYQRDPHLENNTFTTTITLKQEADLSLAQP